MSVWYFPLNTPSCSGLGERVNWNESCIMRPWTSSSHPCSLCVLSPSCTDILESWKEIKVDIITNIEFQPLSSFAARPAHATVHNNLLGCRVRSFTIVLVENEKKAVQVLEHTDCILKFYIIQISLRCCKPVTVFISAIDKRQHITWFYVYVKL